MRLYATAGITEPNLTAEPLGTEGEMTPGPDDQNPSENGHTGSQIGLPPFLGEQTEDVQETYSDRDDAPLIAAFESGPDRRDDGPALFEF